MFILAREGKPIFARHILKTSFSTFDPGQNGGCYAIDVEIDGDSDLGCVVLHLYGVRGVVHTVDVFPSLNATDMKLAHMQCDSMGALNRRRQRCEYYLPC